MNARNAYLVTLLFAQSACTTWTSFRIGYGHVHAAERSLVAVEVERSRGGELHSLYGTIGARVDSGVDQFDASAHVGVMRPLRLSEKFSLVPSARFELGRVSHLRNGWYGGAFGPSAGAELVWWWGEERHTRSRGPMFGCFGGVEGVDCPSPCVSDDVTRFGLSVRASTEYALRFASTFPDRNDWVSFLSVGFARAHSDREDECCYFAPRAWGVGGARGLGEGCERRR